MPHQCESSRNEVLAIQGNRAFNPLSDKPFTNVGRTCRIKMPVKQAKYRWFFIGMFCCKCKPVDGMKFNARLPCLAILLLASFLLGCSNDTPGDTRTQLDSARAPASALEAAPAANRSTRPNILVIYTDDQNYRSLSCDESAPPWVSTPNIDRLANEGVRFTHCYGAPSCAVSRLIMLTGLQPHAIQGMSCLDAETSYDPQRCRFWPATLRQAGYLAAIIGKWHLGNDHGFGRDWDHSVVWTQPPGLGALKNSYRDPALSLDGHPPTTVPGYSTDLYTEHAVEYVRHAHDQPWLLWLCYNAPHGPSEPHERHKDRYRDAAVREPLVATPVSRYLHPDRIGHAERVRNYHRTICAIDEGVARIRKTLEETGQLDNTIIVFTSDNGFAWGENGIEGKLVAYDAHMRIPLIVRFPSAAKSGAVCRTPVALIDLPPTLLAMAGESQPWPMHGHDLQPLLKDPEKQQDLGVMLENFYLRFGSETNGGQTNGPTLNGVPWWISLTDSRYQYIRSLVPDVVEEFYDHRADPLELKNLALEPAHARELAVYRDRLVAELRRTNAAMADKLPAPRIYTKTDN